MTIELVGLGEVMNHTNKNVDLKDLRAKFLAKEKAAEAALEAAEKATLEAEELRIKLAEAVAKDEAETLAEETSEQKIARLEKELANVIIIRELEEKLAAEKAAANNTKAVVLVSNTTAKKQTPAPTAKVEADKLNVTSAPKAEVAVEVYEPEAPTSGVKGSAVRRK